MHGRCLQESDTQTQEHKITMVRSPGDCCCQPLRLHPWRSRLGRCAGAQRGISLCSGFFMKGSVQLNRFPSPGAHTMGLSFQDLDIWSERFTLGSLERCPTSTGWHPAVYLFPRPQGPRSEGICTL